jgi:hypothetical protein
MSPRFTLAAIAALIALTGCAKNTTAKQEPDFTSGPTRVTVTHIPTKTDDGTKVFVTVDGSDAGVLATGQSIEVHLPAGKHQVGGYARSLIGRVTIPPVEVTTSPDSEKYVGYTVAKLKPAFSELNEAPSKAANADAKPQAPQEPKITEVPQDPQA